MAIERMGMSARAYTRILKVARTKSPARSPVCGKPPTSDLKMYQKPFNTARWTATGGTDEPRAEPLSQRGSLPFRGHENPHVERLRNRRNSCKLTDRGIAVGPQDQRRAVARCLSDSVQ